MLPEFHQELFNLLQEFSGDHPEKIALKASKYPELPVHWISTQLKYRQKGKAKLPSWYKTDRVVFPTGLAYEQCSSEATAQYKASLISGKSGIDITGGSGVDSWALSHKFDTFDYCEQQEELCIIARHNFKMLQTPIAVHHQNGLDFLTSHQKRYDCIYLDPHRRSDRQERVYQLADCEPDITQYLNTLFDHADHVLLKASPMADIKACIASLKYVREVHIVSVKNECKEVLFLMTKGLEDNITYTAVNLGSNQEPFSWNEGETAPLHLSMPQLYLYEPNTSILKGGGMDLSGHAFKLSKLHRNSHLFTSEELFPGFPGRIFSILKHGNPKEMKKNLSAGKANISVRNYPMSASDLAKKMKLKDGGNDYLFATTLMDGKHSIIHGKKI